MSSQPTHKLAVNEIFGVTFQGEGRNVGMPCVFLRLSGCNQACVWCDTPYTWDWTGKNGKAYDIKQEVHMMSIEQVADKLLTYPVKNLVVSGGEPMLQQQALRQLLNILYYDGWHVEIETAGTIYPMLTELIDLYTVSLKLSNSGNARSLSLQSEPILAFVHSRKAIFKFVVSTDADFDEIDKLVELYDLRPVYIMLEGIVADKINGENAKHIASEALKRGYHFSTRLQILLYGNQRGV